VEEEAAEAERVLLAGEIASGGVRVDMVRTENRERARSIYEGVDVESFLKERAELVRPFLVRNRDQRAHLQPAPPFPLFNFSHLAKMFGQPQVSSSVNSSQKKTFKGNLSELTVFALLPHLLSPLFQAAATTTRLDLLLRCTQTFPLRYSPTRSSSHISLRSTTCPAAATACSFSLWSTSTSNLLPLRSSPATATTTTSTSCGRHVRRRRDVRST